MGKFVITTRKSGEFQFNLEAGNGEVILTSEGYETKAGCKNGILSVQTNSHLRDRYREHESANGQFYFVLVAGNGQTIGTSEMYKSKSGRDGGIASVIENGRSEVVDDLTV